MKDRIKRIRKDAGLTQKDFGKRIGVEGNTVTTYEKGIRTPSDSVMQLICNEFNVRKEYLYDGVGEPYIQKTKNQEIYDFANSVMKSDDNSIQKRFISALSKLDESEWETIKKIIDKMTEG